MFDLTTDHLIRYDPSYILATAYIFTMKLTSAAHDEGVAQTANESNGHGFKTLHDVFAAHGKESPYISQDNLPGEDDDGAAVRKEAFGRRHKLIMWIG